MNKPLETWDSADAYERWVGRWSRNVAGEFLRWLVPAPHLAWADIGCGSGQLTTCVLADYEPRSVAGLDASQAFVAQARSVVRDPRARFETGDATSLPWETDTIDVAVSGLVLNFVSDHLAMTREMARVTRPGGSIAAYVWDYAGGMKMMRYFWDAAITLNPNDAKLDQAERFPLCQPEPLRSLFESAGLESVEVRSIDIPTVFRDFDDYWTPFLGRQGAAPTYLASLDVGERDRIREVLRLRLASAPGPIELTARAWAVKGRV
jgi:trans-aconitate methyltransferase